jgi:hypothetical protein
VARRAGRREVGNLERLHNEGAWTGPPQVILYAMQDNYLFAMAILCPCKNMFAVSGQGGPTLRPRWVAVGRHLAGAHFLQGIRSAHVDLAHAVAEQSNGCIGSRTALQLGRVKVSLPSRMRTLGLLRLRASC